MRYEVGAMSHVLGDAFQAMFGFCRVGLSSSLLIGCELGPAIDRACSLIHLFATPSTQLKATVMFLSDLTGF